MKKILCLALLSSLAVQTQAFDIRAGLLSYYPFNSSTTDDVAYTNNFIAVAAPILVTTNPAPRNSVLQLNGSSQYLRLDHSTDNAPSGFPIYNARTYSVTMWVKGAAQTGRYLFSHGNSTTTTPLFVLQTGNAAANNAKFDVVLRNDANTTLLNHPASAATVFDNTWHHVAWVDNAGAVQLYVDGVLDANSSSFNYTRSGTFTFDRSAVGTLIRTTVSTGNIFNGAIDDLSFFERVLTQAEVQNIMANGLTTPVPTNPILLTEPVSVTKNFQDTATFSVTAVSARPNAVLSYQWNLNNSPITDATNRTYRIFNLTTANSGEMYSVTVGNSVSSLTTSNATLTVLADPPSNVRSNIVSYWPLDTVTNDAGVYSTIDIYGRNDFLLFNTTEANLQPGQFGNALLFDNLASTYAVRSTGSPIYRTNGYSVSFWVYKPDGPDVTQNDVRVFSESSTNSNNPLFTIGTTGTGTSMKVLIRNDASAPFVDRASTRPVFDGQWHHVLWSDTNGNAKLYIDGSLDETDFAYTPSGQLTLNVTSLGAILRTNLTLPSNGIFAEIDEVATWTRALTYTEVQELKSTSVPAPLPPTPAEITSQPVSTNVLTGANATFSVTVTGLGPFQYQWRKGTSPLADQTNSTLTLLNVQLSDAGNYNVVISNPGGSTNSQDAALVVTQRPVPPSVLALDFNNRTQGSGNTEAGFDSFTLDGTSAGNNPTTLPTTRLFGGVEVTVGGSDGTTVDSRLRATPNTNVDFTQSLLLKDFVFSPPTTGASGLDVTVRFLLPNQQYAVTVWNYDSGQGAGERKSDWYANGNLVVDDYTFDTANPPTNNIRYQFSFYATTDANGQLLISGRRDNVATAATVFLNGLKVAIPTAPSIDKQPVAQNVFTSANASFYVNAVGVGPLTYQWFKGGSPVSGAQSSVLQLNNVAAGDAGNYFVRVGNNVGNTDSDSVALTVTPRPAPPSVVSIDFNNRNEETNFTEPGFDSFVLAGSGAIALPTMKLFGGVEVTVSGSSGTALDSRRRVSITNSGSFTQEKLLSDFIYSTITTNNEGIDVQVRFLAPNQAYKCTIWSFDDQQGATNAEGNVVVRTADWYANGVLVKDNYSFTGTTTNEPVDNLQYQFSFNATTDAQGTLVLQGRRDMPEPGISVFLNALRVGLPVTSITSIQVTGGNVRLILDTPNSAQTHQVQETPDLSNPVWTTVTGVTTTVLSPTTLQLEFPVPNGNRFYRINRVGQ